jgi:hypothetical protein
LGPRGQKDLSPFPVFIHNLNHVSVFLLTLRSSLRLSCLPSGQPVLAYPSPTYLVGLSAYVIKSFFEPRFAPFTLPPIVFVFFVQQICFTPPPPGSCHPRFTFPYPFHLPDLLQPACFSACLLSVWPLLPLLLGELD